MKLLVSLVLVLAFLVIYAFWLRSWLKTKLWAQGFFAWVEPLEIFLFRKSETILFARLKILSGLVLTLLTQLGTIDLTPLMPFVPDQYEGVLRAVFNLLPLIITVMGWMDESLRKSTTKPIELVSVPEAKMTSEVTEAIAVAEMAKVEAVTAVAESKAS